MCMECNIHGIHVSGTRMSVQGTDGGSGMLSFILLALMIFQRQDNLREWVDSWRGVEMLVGWNRKGGLMVPNRLDFSYGPQLLPQLRWLLSKCKIFH
jgi:hypothetical protein